MPEIGTPGLMSGDGKRGVGHRPQATAPILDFTATDFRQRTAPFLKWSKITIRSHGTAGTGLFRPLV